MRRLAPLLLLIAALPLPGAPAPLPRPPRLCPGEWVLAWGSALGPLSLGRDGSCVWRSGDLTWLGTWRWDSRTHTLHVDEHRADGAEPYSVVTNRVVWQAVLDHELKGTAKTTYGAWTQVHIYKPGSK